MSDLGCIHWGRGLATKNSERGGLAGIAGVEILTVPGLGGQDDGTTATCQTCNVLYPGMRLPTPPQSFSWYFA